MAKENEKSNQLSQAMGEAIRSEIFEGIRIGIYQSMPAEEQILDVILIAVKEATAEYLEKNGLK